MSVRFTYIKYDKQSEEKQEKLKNMFDQIEDFANNILPNGREKSLFMTYLEVAYMWSGKAIRDEQIARNSQPEHCPERG